MFRCEPTYNASNDLMFTSMSDPVYVNCQESLLNTISSVFAMIGWLTVLLVVTILFFLALNGLYVLITEYSVLNKNRRK